MILEAVTAASLALMSDAPPSWVALGHENQSNFLDSSQPADRPISQISTGESGPIMSFVDDAWFQTYWSGFRKATDLALVAAANRAAALGAIEDFKNLPRNWAGDDTKLPLSQTRSAAKALILSLPGSVPTPNVGPSADGEIGFSWVKGTKRIESILAPEGHLVWFWSDGKRVFPGSEENFNGSFPDDLLEALGADRD